MKPLKTLRILTPALALVLLAACGNTPEERAITGAGIGAATGGAGGLLLGSPTGGAVLGSAAGAATGAFTDEGDIDLGDPIWE